MDYSNPATPLVAEETIANIFHDAYKGSGMSYSEIGKLLSPVSGRASAYTYITNPGRATLLTMLDVGRVLGIDPEQTKSCWREHKIAYWTGKVDGVIASTYHSF